MPDFFSFFLSSHMVLRLLTKSQVPILKNILHTSLLTANPMLTATVGNLWKTRNKVLLMKNLPLWYLSNLLRQQNPTWSTVTLPASKILLIPYYLSFARFCNCQLHLKHNLIFEKKMQEINSWKYQDFYTVLYILVILLLYCNRTTQCKIVNIITSHHF